MTKEELQKLICETQDETLRKALWELYELKFNTIKYVPYERYYPYVVTTPAITYRDYTVTCDSSNGTSLKAF